MGKKRVNLKKGRGEDSSTSKPLDISRIPKLRVKELPLTHHKIRLLINK